MSKTKTFRIGEKVECIDDLFTDEETNPFQIDEICTPSHGVVYTVRSVVPTAYGTEIRLREITNQEFYFDEQKRMLEPAFSAERFKIVK